MKIILTHLLALQVFWCFSLNVTWAQIDTLQFHHAYQKANGNILPDSAVVFAFQALKEANRANFRSGQYRSYLLLSNLYYKLYQHDSALVYALGAEKYIDDVELDKLYQVNRALGSAYFLSKEDEKSHKYYLKSLQLAEQLQDTSKMSAGLNNVAIGLSRLARYGESTEYYKRAIRLSKTTGDLRGSYYAALNLSSILRFMGELDSAYFYGTMARELAVQRGEANEIAKSNFSLAMTALLKNDYRQAIELHQETLATDSLELKDIAKAHFGLAEAYNSLRDYDNAIYYGKRALQLHTEIGDTRFQMNSLGILIDLYRKQGNYKRAFETREQYFELYKNTFSEQRSQQMQELQERYESEKKEARILQLNQQQAIDSLRLNQQRLLILLLTLFFILAIVISFIVIRQNKLKAQRDKNTLEQQLLRAQMNPHFIFNALAAIQDAVLSNSPKEAVRVLSKFSHLIRRILDLSTFKKISCSEEVQLLKDYLEIQRFRFKENFDFEIEISPEIDVDDIQLPPMLIQPLVENALEHGLAEVKYQGKVKLTFKLEKDILKINVEDNGKGIVENSEKGSSIALSNIRERLKYLDKVNSYLHVAGNKEGRGTIATLHVAV
ncbi:MAG: histidine kinase [Bacteroidota bacterium]